LFAAPAVIMPMPYGEYDLLRKLRHLQTERPVGVEGERSTIEDQLILPADLIGIDHRQLGFDHLLENHLMTPIHLRAVIGRTIRHKQDLGAALRQGFSYTEFTPNVFTDRYSDANTTEVDRARHWAGLKYPLLIKLAIIRQIHLEPFRNNLAAIQNDNGVMQTTFTTERRTNNDARPSVRGVVRQITNSLFARSKKRWFQNQIFRRIS